MNFHVGVSKLEITPPAYLLQAGRIFLWGYGFRTQPADSIRDPLWARALAIADEFGNRIVLVSLDICAVDQAFSAAVRENLMDSHALPPECLAINLTHTHSAPVAVSIPTWNPGADAPDPKYLDFLRQRVVDAAREALDSIQPASLYFIRGESGIGLNRHVNAAGIPASPDTCDRTLDVLQVVDAVGKNLAVAVFHGCHAVFLKGQAVSADFPGIAREVVESAAGGTALFFQGYAGTVNPVGEDMLVTGNQLAQDAIQLLAGPRKPIAGSIQANLLDFQLPFQPLPTGMLEQAQNQETDPNLQRWANSIASLGSDAPETLPVQLQAFRIGAPPNAWLIAASSHEVVTEFASPVRSILPGIPTSLLGYTNFCLSYIPTRSILNEPGHQPFPFSLNYEGASSFSWYGQPAPLSSQVDELFLQANVSLIKKLAEV